MANEELYSIVQRVKNGEKAEEIIDFSRQNIDGLSPEEALEFINSATICNTCKKNLENEELFFCKNCVEKSKEHFYQTGIGKALKNRGDNGWGWIFGLMFFAGLGNNNNDKDKEN